MADVVLHCPHCGQALPPSAASATQDVDCPACGRGCPTPGSFAPPPTPPTFKPGGQKRWWVRLPNGRPSGPGAGEVIEAWIRDGRAGPGTFVAVEGETSWRPIEADFEALCAKRFPNRIARARPYAPGRNPLAGLPATRILEAVPDYRGTLPTELRRKHIAVHDRLVRECARSTAGIEVVGSRSMILREITPAVRRPSSRLVVETVLFSSLRTGEQEFFLVVPWGPLGQMPHEFFSVLPGAFPTALAQRRESEEDADRPIWFDSNGCTDSALAQAARDADPPLGAGVNWRWISESGGYEMVLVWSVQFIPLGTQQWLHLVSTACHGALRRTLGVDWYLQRQQAAIGFRESLPEAGDHEPHFLFASVTAQVVSRLLEL